MLTKKQCAAFRFKLLSIPHTRGSVARKFERYINQACGYKLEDLPNVTSTDIPENCKLSRHQLNDVLAFMFEVYEDLGKTTLSITAFANYTNLPKSESVPLIQLWIGRAIGNQPYNSLE
jgi:hypothetical protein